MNILMDKRFYFFLKMGQNKHFPNLVIFIIKSEQNSSDISTLLLVFCFRNKGHEFVCDIRG